MQLTREQSALSVYEAAVIRCNNESALLLMTPSGIPKRPFTIFVFPYIRRACRTRRKEKQDPSKGRETLTRAFAEAMYETLRSTETPPGGPATVQSAAVVKTSTMVAMQPPWRVPYRF
jgi:hypothetical protein